MNVSSTQQNGLDLEPTTQLSESHLNYSLIGNLSYVDDSHHLIHYATELILCTCWTCLVPNQTNRYVPPPPPPPPPLSTSWRVCIFLLMGAYLCTKVVTFLVYPRTVVPNQSRIYCPVVTFLKCHRRPEPMDSGSSVQLLRLSNATQGLNLFNSRSAV